MHISQHYSYHPDRFWYPCDHICIVWYDTAYSDCLKRGANMCLCPPQDFTMNYTYTIYLSISYSPPTIQQLIHNYFLHAIHCSERLEYFCILKSCWWWSCASNGLRSSATDGYLFLNYICLSICLSYARLSYARGREGEHNIKTDYLFNYLNSPVCCIRSTLRITSSNSIIAGHNSDRWSEERTPSLCWKSPCWWPSDCDSLSALEAPIVLWQWDEWKHSTL
jgi:hypothetical protein